MLGSHAVFGVQQHASLALPSPDLYPLKGGVERMIANLKKSEREKEIERDYWQSQFVI